MRHGFFESLRRLRRRFGRTSSLARGPVRSRPFRLLRLEPLEERQLLATTPVSLTNGQSLLVRPGTSSTSPLQYEIGTTGYQTVSTSGIVVSSAGTGPGSNLVEFLATGSGGNGYYSGSSLQFIGAGTGNTLQAGNQTTALTWSITSANSGSVAGVTNLSVSFSTAQNLTGGSENDSFVFSAGVGVTGNVVGGGGTDALNFSNYTTAVTVNLQSDTATGTAAPIGGTFSQINTLIGNTSASNTLIGPNTASTWVVNSAGGGTVAGYTFSSFQNLQGGTTGANTFTFSGGSITGTLAGEAGPSNDTLGGSSITSVTLTTSSSSGFSGTTTAIGGGFSGIGVLNGAGTGSTLTGESVASTWTLGTSDTYYDGSNTLTFSSFANLTGGTGNDDFQFKTGASISGNVVGGDGGGTDTLDYSLYTGAETVTLTSIAAGTAAGTATGIGGTFSGIAIFTGNNSSAGTLTGPNTASTWQITGNDSGTVGPTGAPGVTVSFSAFQNLSGGTAADDFEFSAGKTLSGSINGGGGGDTLDFSQYTTPVSVTLGATSESGTVTSPGNTAPIGGTFTNIAGVLGGGTTNTLTGSSSATSTTWNINGTNAETVNGTNYTGFQFLVSGSGANNANDFVFDNGAAVSGGVTGNGGGHDTMDFSRFSSDVGVNLQAGSVSYSTSTGGSGSAIVPAFSGIATVIGADTLPSGSTTLPINTITGKNASTTWDITGTNAETVGAVSFTTFQNLIGGTGSNDFVFSNGASVTGNVVGGGGTETLDVSAYTTAVTVNLAGSTATATTTGNSPIGSTGGTFSGINTFAGSNGVNDSLVGPNASNTWDIQAYDSGTLTSGVGLAAVTYTFSNFEGLTGGSGTDDFVFSNGAIVSGFINGGGGTNTLDYTAYKGPPVTTTVTVNLATTPGTASGLYLNESTPYVYDLYNINFVFNPSGSEIIYGSNNQFNYWVITGTNSGTLNGTAFSGAGGVTLLGGNDGDQFLFSGGNITGSIVGGTGGSETIISYSVVNSWTINGSNAGTLTETLGSGNVTDTFSNIQNLADGSGTDTFNFDNGDGISGSIEVANGVSGAGTLNFSAYSTALTVNLTANLVAGTLGGTVSGTSTPIGGNFTGIADIEGGSTATNNTLVGPSAANTWNITSSNAGTVAAAGAGAVSFSSFGNLEGGTASDTFTFSTGSIAGVLIGQGVSETLTGSEIVNVTLDVPNPPTTSDFTGTTTAISGGFTGMNVLTGAGTGPGTLTGENAAATWTLGTSDTYSDGTATLTFSGFATLQGGSVSDIFNVSAVNTAAISGGTGTETLEGIALINVTLIGSSASGFSGTTAAVDSGSSGGFTNIDVLKGAGTGTLTGENTVSTWSLGTSDTYFDGSYTLKFSQFATLQGGSAADTFNVTAANTANLDGGGGVNAFNIGATLTGAVAGQAGSNTLTFTAISNAALTSSSAQGFSGTATTISGGFSGIDALIGAGGGTLTGETYATATWTLNASPTYNDGSYSLPFSGFAKLQGGTVADTFNVSVATTAAIAGGAGTETLEGSAIVNVTLVSSSASGFSGTTAAVDSGSSGGFTGIDVLIGAGGSAGTLTGENAASTWTLGASDIYNDGGTANLTFSGFGTLQGGTGGNYFTVSLASTANLLGGAGNDTFEVDAILTGEVDGQGGTNTLTGSQIVNVTILGSDNGVYGTVTGTLGTPSVTGGFFNINVLPNSGDIYISTPLTPTGNLTFDSKRNIYFEAGGSVTTTSSLTLLAPDGEIDVLASNPSVPNVTASSLMLTASTGIGTTNLLTTSVATLSFSNTSSGPVNVTDTAADSASTVTVSGTNASSTAPVTIVETLGSLAVGAAGISDTAGINLQAGQAITEGGGLSTLALVTNSAAGTTLLGANLVGSFSASNTGSGNVSLSNDRALALGNVSNTVSGGSVTFDNTDAVTQNTDTSITAAGLELLGSGPYTLANSGNQVTMLAGNVTGTINYQDAGGFAIGTVNSTVGLTSLSSTVTLGTSGTVTESAPITTSGLELLGTGSYSLTDSGNQVATLAANVAGSVSYYAAGGFQIGTVNNTVGLTSLLSNVTLSTGGTVTEPTAAITAVGLELLGTGSYGLTNSGNQVATLAGNVTGAINFTAGADVTVGTVAATNGLASTDGPISVVAVNDLTIAVGAQVTSTNGAVTLNGGLGIDIPGGWNDTVGLFNPATSTFDLRNSNTSGGADTVVQYGPAGSNWIPLCGDWSGSSEATIGLYNPQTSTFYLQESNTAGLPDVVVPFQPTTDVCTPVVGAWSGGGADEVGLYDPQTGTFYLAGSNTPGTGYNTVTFKPTSDPCLPVVGDWTGSGVTTIGLYDPTTSTFYERNTNTSGGADTTVQYGPAGGGWIPLSGDWTGSGTSTIGLYNPQTSTFYLRDSNTAGAADTAFTFGAAGAGWIPLDGQWNETGAAVTAGGAVTLKIGTAVSSGGGVGDIERPLLADNGAGQVQINGFAGGNTVTLDLGAVGAPASSEYRWSFNGVNGSNNTLVLSDTADTDDVTIDDNSQTVQWNAEAGGQAAASPFDLVQYAASSQYPAAVRTIQLHTGGGDDQVTFNVSANPAIKTNVDVDGGGYSGNPATGLCNALKIIGSSAAGDIRVGTWSASSPSTDEFQVENIQSLQIFGGSGSGAIYNDSAVNALLAAGNGTTGITGGHAQDVIFGGPALTSLVGGYGADYLLPDEQLSRGNGQYQLQAITSVPGPAVTAQAGYNNIIVTTTRDELVGGFGGATLVTNGNPQLSVLDWLTVHIVVWTQEIADNEIGNALAEPWTKYF
jgi:hypothetical protein